MFRDSMVAIVTPMNVDGSVDYESLKRLVDWHVAEGTSCIISVGTTGESSTIGFSEHIEVVRKTVELVDSRIKVMAGAGGNSTVEAIELTRLSEQAGADGILSVVPYYNKPPQRGIYAHFEAVANATKLPVVLYNVPGRTVTDMHNDTVVELSQIDNIIGLKDATGDLERHKDLRARLPKDFGLFSGEDATGCEYLILGGDGVISVTANVAPNLMAQMCRQVREGDAEAARQTNVLMVELHKNLFIEPSPMPTKWALSQMGLIEENYRLPLVQLGEEYYDVVRGALKKANIEV